MQYLFYGNTVLGYKKKEKKTIQKLLPRLDVIFKYLSKPKCVSAPSLNM
jgi:hypothetical protein